MCVCINTTPTRVYINSVAKLVHEVCFTTHSEADKQLSSCDIQDQTQIVAQLHSISIIHSNQSVHPHQKCI